MFEILQKLALVFIFTMVAAIYLLPTLKIVRMFVNSGKKLKNSFYN